MFRRLKRLFIVLFALALIVFAGVPLLVSTGWVRGKVEKSIAGSLNRPVSIGSVSYWWFSGIRVKGLAVGGGDLAVARVKVDPSLPGLLSGTKDIGAIAVEGVKLRVVKKDDGSYAVPALEGRREKPETAEEPEGEPTRVLLSVAVRGIVVEVADERGAVLGAWECPTADVSVDTGGSAGPLAIRAAVSGVFESADLTMTKTGMNAVAKIDADLAALGKIVPVGTARRLRSTVMFTREAGKFTLVVKDTTADHGLDFSPDLRDDAVMSAELSGDLDAGWVRLDKPAELRHGPLALSVTGELDRGADGNWDGVFAGKLSGRIPRPSEEVTASGRIEGEMSLALKGGGKDLALSVRLLDVVFAQPGTKEIREKLVTIEAKAGQPAGGRFTVSKAEVRGEGVSLALLEPNEQGGLVKGGGLLNRLQPFMPGVDWDSAGRFELSARLVRGVEGNALREIRLTTGFLNLSGEAELGGGTTRVRLSGNGNLARLPKGLLPEKFGAEGTFTSGPIEVSMGGGSLAASGAVEFRDFAVGGSARSAKASLAFSVAKTGDTTRLGEVRFATDRATVLVTGTLSGRRFDGSLDAKGDLSVVPPSLMPKGYAGTGPVEARLVLSGETGDLVVSGAGLRLTAPEESPVDVGEVRFTGQPSWRDGARFPTLREGRLTCARVRMRDYSVATGSVYPVTFDDGVLDAPSGDFAVNNGTVSLRECRVDIRGEKPVWSLRYEVSNVETSAKMSPEAKYLAPIFGGATGLSGLLGTKGQLGDRGEGQGLAGDVGFALNKGVIQGSPLLSAILGWLKRQTQLNFTEIAGQLRIGGGRIGTTGGPLRIVTEDLTILFDGFTDLAGPLDYHVRVKFPEGSAEDSRWRKALKDGIIPMRITGTLDSPSLAPPALDKLAEGVLEDLFKKGVKDGLGGLIPGRK